MKDNEVIQLPAVFTGFGSRSDGGASLRFATQELTDVDFAQLKKIHNSFGWILFKPQEFTDADVPKEDAERTGKTPSRRLRNTLYVFWQQTESSGGDFEAFYRQEMEKFIDHVKGKIDLF